MYKDLLDYIVKNLVNSPEAVQIDELKLDDKIVLKLKHLKEILV